ncbi:MAG: DUF2975 domain-containing protein [Pseudomonadota bacterium]
MPARFSDRTTTLSLTARHASDVCMIAIPVLATGVWLVEPDPLVANFRAEGAPPLSNQQIASCIALTLVPSGLLAIGLWHLGRLFRLFARRAHFTKAVARHLRGFAWYLLASALVSPFASAAIGVVASWFNPPGQKILAFAISGQGVLAILLAALLFALARVMIEAQQMADDQRFIV